MGILFKHLRNGMRASLHHPSFTVVAVLVIALGIGANTGIFVHSVLPRSVPSPDLSSPPVARGKVSPANHFCSKSPNHMFGDLAGVADLMSLHLTGAGEPEELLAGAVSVNFFQMIGVHPILGRAFVPEEDKRGNDHVVILSHRLWIRRFRGDAGIVGKRIVLNGESRQVIGVLPADFSWNNRHTDVWVPYATAPDRDYRAASGGYLPVAALALRYE
jgi:hypothetical protein